MEATKLRAINFGKYVHVEKITKAFKLQQNTQCTPRPSFSSQILVFLSYIKAYHNINTVLPNILASLLKLFNIVQCVFLCGLGSCEEAEFVCRGIKILCLI